MRTSCRKSPAWPRIAERGVVLIVSLWFGGGAVAALAQVPTAEFLGAKIFADPGLSASGAMSCASCHVPARAHAPDSAQAVVPGGPQLHTPGLRAVPSLRYLNMTLGFSFDKEGTANGGLNRDGSAPDPLAQAQRPFLAAHEMANATPADVVARLRTADYAGAFQQRFGATVFEDAQATFLAMRFALSQFQRNAPEFRPFDSKYDLFLKGRQRLSTQELRGLAWFNRPDKGNCAACHTSARGSDGSMPLFTDFSFDNLGVPRNRDIPANDDPAYADYGLCGRADLAARDDLCGAFKVPTLRNVATRKVFFHNGVFDNLADVIRFYVRRDTNPEEFYPVDSQGVVHKFDDLPASLHRYVNTSEVPYDRRLGQAPRLNPVEIDDVVAFLKTLTDGYDPVTDSADPARSLSRPDQP